MNFQPDIHLVRSRELTLFTESFGDRDAPAILLIMGATASGAWWPDGFCAFLAAAHRRVIRYDHRDTVGSTSYGPGAAPYTLEDLADDAIRVLDGLGVGTAHLVGMSLGGYIAQLLALKYPERILSLTLIASEALMRPTARIRGISQKVLDYHLRSVNVDWTNPAEVVNYRIGTWAVCASSDHPFDHALHRAMAESEMARTADPQCAFNHAALSEAPEWQDRLTDIRQPALVIHGAEDSVVDFAHAELLCTHLPRARLLKLVGVAHELPRRIWPRVAREIVAAQDLWTPAGPPLAPSSSCRSSGRPAPDVLDRSRRGRAG